MNRAAKSLRVTEKQARVTNGLSNKESDLFSDDEPDSEMKIAEKAQSRDSSLQIIETKFTKLRDRKSCKVQRLGNRSSKEDLLSS